MHLHFRKLGSGPHLVILHGLYGSSDNWLTMAKKLENQFTIWLPDQRNHGQSPHASTHTYPDLVNDLTVFFEQHQIEQAVLIGHSMGGKVAMLFAADYPEKVTSLIIVDIAPKSYIQPGVIYNHVRQHELILQLISNLDLSAVTSRSETDHYFANKLNDNSLRLFLLKNIHRDKEGRFTWKINVQVLKESITAIINDVNENWFASRIPILNYPVTFIRGLNSDYLTDKDIPLIRTIYPEARIVDIANAGHWLHAEQPEAFLSAVLEAAS